MDCGELNFTEICRCCKRTAPQMIFIFDRKAHPTYPPVHEMLKSIASLKVQENDGLPSLVCISCLHHIQDAFTFILQIIQIDEELSKILARRKALPQSTYDTNLCTSMYIKKETESAPIQAGTKHLENFHDNEDLNVDQPLKEEFDEPMLNFYQKGSSANNVENIDLDVKREDDPVPEIDYTGNENLSENDDNISMVQKAEDMEDFENLDVIVLDEEYQEDDDKEAPVEGSESSLMISLPLQLLKDPLGDPLEDNTSTGNFSVNDYDYDLLRVQKTEDMAEYEEVGNSTDSSKSEEFSPKSRKRRKKNTPKVDDELLFKCNLCAFINSQMCRLKRHLLTHFKDKPFPCLKCNRTFGRSDKLLIHSRNCNGDTADDNNKYVRLNAKPVISLTLEDMKDPLKLKNYYTECKRSDVEKNVDDEQSTAVRAEDVEIGKEIICPEGRKGKLNCILSDGFVFKCKLCAFTSVRIGNLRRHLLLHSMDKPFPCSKCNDSFDRRDKMLCHWRNCNGDVNSRKRKSSKQVILTLEDVHDPMKIKNFYTVCKKSDLQNNDDDLKKSRPKRERNTSKLTVFKCKLCVHACRQLSAIKKHLFTHSKEQPFACSKCDHSFGRRDKMLSHWRNCTGTNNSYKDKVWKKVIVLTLQDIIDPEKMKQYYTETEIDLQNNDDLKVQIAEDCPKRPKTTSKLPMYKCTLCTKTCAYMSDLKQHLQTHCTDKPFACSRCDLTFMRRDKMVRHWRICNSEITNVERGNYGKIKATKQVTSLTTQDLKDPLNMKKYYTVIEIDVRNKDDDDIEGPGEGPKSKPKRIRQIIPKFKCKLCPYTCGFISTLKLHLQTHSKSKPFTCSKCNGTFTRSNSMIKHRSKCNGEVSRYALGKEKSKAKATKQMVTLSPQDLKDPLEIKKYYSVAEDDVRNNDDDGLEVQNEMQRAEDKEGISTMTAEIDVRNKNDDDVQVCVEVQRAEDEEGIGICAKSKRSPTKRKQTETSKFKCKLCPFACAFISSLKLHLQTHCKDKPFTCSKCNGRFTRIYDMENHSQKCKGRKRRRSPMGKGGASNPGLVSRQDLEDPLEMKKYYTEIL